MAKTWCTSNPRHNLFGYTDEDYTASTLVGDIWVLSSLQLLEARKLGIIDKFPNITEAQISDKNKGDGLVKSLAALQVLWLAIQLLIRTVMGLQSSQLEITALAFAICAFVTYLLLYSQPKDVQAPVTIHAQRTLSHEEFKRFVEKFARPAPLSETGYTLSTTAMPFPRSGYNYTSIFRTGTYGGLSIFGAIHLTAWNLSYPHDIERLCWRISALLVTILPVVLGVLGSVAPFPDYLRLLFDTRRRITSRVIKFILAVGWIFLFPVARLYLLVEAFRSTYYLPPSTYAATWASNIPHFG